MTKKLSSMSDDELLVRLNKLLKQSRRLESDLVAHIGEVDARQLYAREACPSMFAYCTERLNLSEHEAYLRIGVARAARRHPVLLEVLAEGRLPLSAIARLAPQLTEDNCDGVLARAFGKSKREIEELVAELSPKPDVPTMVRKLPEPVAKAKPTAPAQLVPERVTFLHTATPAPPAPPPRRGVVEPLSPAKYKVQFTASAELHDKLNRLRALMRASVPDGDLAGVIEEAVTEKLERLEAKRFAKAKKPRKSAEDTDTSPSSRYIPAPIRREVYQRNGNRCTFADERGRRCSERDNLEFHHRDPYGRGGIHSPENLELMCRAHNRYLAEMDYGKEVMGRYRSSSVRKRGPVFLGGADFAPKPPASAWARLR